MNLTEMKKEAFAGAVVNALLTAGYASDEFKKNKMNARLTSNAEPGGAAGANQSQFTGGKVINQQPPQLPNYSLFS